MNKGLKKAIFGFILPVIAIVIVGRLNIWLGIAAVLIYFAVLIYLLRTTFFTILGSRKYSMGEIDQALMWFKRAYDTKKSGVRATVSYAYILLKNADHESSEAILQKLLKENPSSHDVHYIKSILALAIWKKGDLDTAVAMLEEVIENYKTTSVYGSLGYLLVLKGDLEKALQFNLEAQEYNSSDKIILDNLGQNYYLLGMYEKAREIYEPLLEKKPSFPEPYYNYGLVLEKLGNPEAAVDIMRKALDFKFTYLSTISKDEVNMKIQEISTGL